MFKQKKILLILSELLIGYAARIGSSTIAILNPSAGNITLSSTALLT